MSDPSRPPHDAGGDDAPAGDHTKAVAALRAAFTRLQPQGSDAWNFLAAFTHLGDRYGPYQPGASGLSALLQTSDAPPTGRRDAWKRRLLQKAGPTGAGPAGAAPGALPGATGATSELEDAMAQVVEAFRFLSARVRTLEERLALADHPIDGAAWFVPARDLEGWLEPVAAHIVGATPGGEVVHADCGEGSLLGVLEQAGVAAHGVEPRGTIGLAALEQGRSVALAEVADELAARPAASLGGLVLSGVVDRLALHALVSLLARSRRALTSGAPLVIVASDPERFDARIDVVARDLLHPRPLHVETWSVLLRRAGFVSVAPLPGGEEGDGRFAISASTPA